MFRSLILPLLIRVMRSPGASSEKLKLMFIPVILFALGVLFALITLHIYLTKQYDSIFANLSFAIGFVVVGIVYKIYLSYKLKAEKKINKKANLTDRVISETSELTGINENSIKQGIDQVMNKHSKVVLLGAVVAGFLLGKNGLNSTKDKKD